MTRDQALRDFKSFYQPARNSKGRIDRPALYEAWGEYLDALCKDGKITLRQYETWENPTIVSVSAESFADEATK